MPKHKAAKPATVVDISLRAIVTDLVDRGQIPVLYKFAQDLGFKTSNQVSYFLNGERNFPIAKLDTAMNALVKKYKANKTFLQTGHGSMYKGKPYVMEDEIPQIELKENVLSYGAMKKVQELERINDELRKRIQELEKRDKHKDQLIETQQDLISQLKTRTKKRT